MQKVRIDPALHLNINTLPEGALLLLDGMPEGSIFHVVDNGVSSFFHFIEGHVGGVEIVTDDNALNRGGHFIRLIMYQPQNTPGQMAPPPVMARGEFFDDTGRQTGPGPEYAERTLAAREPIDPHLRGFVDRVEERIHPDQTIAPMTAEIARERMNEREATIDEVEVEPENEDVDEDFNDETHFSGPSIPSVFQVDDQSIAIASALRNNATAIAKSLSDTSIALNQATSQMAILIRKEEELKIQLNSDEHVSKLNAAIEEAKGLEYVEDIKIVKKDMGPPLVCIETKELVTDVLEEDGTRRIIGRMMILISVGAFSFGVDGRNFIQIFNKDRALVTEGTTYHAPHVSSGGFPCFGTASEAIARGVATFSIVSIVESIRRLICTPNEHDAYGEQVFKFPEFNESTDEAAAS